MHVSGGILEHVPNERHLNTPLGFPWPTVLSVIDNGEYNDDQHSMATFLATRLGASQV